MTIIDLESLYHIEAVKCFVAKANKKEISPYLKRAYAASKETFEQSGNNISLEEFAAYNANSNPNKSGIGEKCQILFLSQDKYVGIKALPNNGNSCIKICTEKGKIVLKQGKEKSSLQGIKSFDAIHENEEEITLFVLKTTDLGIFSDSIGGGHQDNVRIELLNLINALKGILLSFNGKNVQVAIIIDGRYAASIIEACKKFIDPKHDNIIIGTCESI